MDIRNIKTAPPQVNEYLYAMFDMEHELLKGYCGKIEKELPMPPIDIQSYGGQQVLKDFTARVIEETAEGYESTTYALGLAEKVGYNLDLLSDDQTSMLLNHLQNSNEEQADATDFFMALMMYANLGPDDIYQYARIKTKNLNIGDLDDLMGIGKELLQKEYPEFTQEEHLYNLINDGIIHDQGLETKEVYSYIPGFHHSSKQFHREEDNMLWQVCYHLNISRNFLKNKPWKQTQELTDVTRYDEQLVLGFIKYMGYLKFMGFTGKSLYTLVYKKIQINHFRQNSGY